MDSLFGVQPLYVIGISLLFGLLVVRRPRTIPRPAEMLSVCLMHRDARSYIGV